MNKNQPYINYQLHPQIKNQQLLQSQFVQTFNTIKQQLAFRNDLIKSLNYTEQNSEKWLSANKKQNIVTHCNQYYKIGNLIPNILTNTFHGNFQLIHQNFWQSNQSLQKQLQLDLRDLKTLDTVIDNIVNQEFDKCNQIDQIDQTIRLILSKKDEGHIAKAQPFYQQKQMCLDSLNEKKQQKEKIKIQKYNQVKKILDLLLQLKRHRQTGLKNTLSEGKDKMIKDNQQNLLDRAISDIKEIQKNQNYLSNLQLQTKDLNNFIIDMQRRIDDHAKQLLNFIDQQNEACIQLQQLAKMKSQTSYFQTSIFSVFGISNLRKISKKQFITALNNVIGKLQNHSRQMREKQKQAAKIEQGIQTTKRTISIFEHILQKIQTQNSRKKLLLGQIQKMQLKHEQQQKILIVISENQNQFEKLKLCKNQLNKNLDNKMNEANVVAYKNIHQQILKLQNQIKVKGKKIQNLKLTASQNARKLYDQTMGLQQQYEDILSQIMPSLWLKGSDFTKQEAIKDLNIYLLRTFKRLSIAD